MRRIGIGDLVVVVRRTFAGLKLGAVVRVNDMFESGGFNGERIVVIQAETEMGYEFTSPSTYFAHIDDVLGDQHVGPLTLELLAKWEEKFALEEEQRIANDAIFGIAWRM